MSYCPWDRRELDTTEQAHVHPQRHTPCEDRSKQREEGGVTMKAKSGMMLSGGKPMPRIAIKQQKIERSKEECPPSGFRGAMALPTP